MHRNKGPAAKALSALFQSVQFVQPLLLEDIAVFQHKVPVIVAEKSVFKPAAAVHILQKIGEGIGGEGRVNLR